MYCNVFVISFLFFHLSAHYLTFFNVSISWIMIFCCCDLRPSVLLSTVTNLLPLSCNFMIVSLSLLNLLSLLEFVNTLLFVRVRLTFTLSTLVFWNKFFQLMLVIFAIHDSFFFFFFLRSQF